jgi:hypothetical protein
MKFINFLFILLLSSLSNLSGFTLHINNHYSTIAGKILNLNSILNYRFYNNDDNFYCLNNYNLEFYNSNKSMYLALNDKYNIKYLLKDKYNYFISFDIYKYKYKIIVKSKPISYNYTELDIDIRQNRNNKFNNTALNFNHYRKIDNIIYKYIYNNIIIKNKEEMSTELFRFFNNY